MGNAVSSKRRDRPWWRKHRRERRGRNPCNTVVSNKFTSSKPSNGDDFGSLVEQMWSRPISMSTARDAVRLAGRVDVNSCDFAPASVLVAGKGARPGTRFLQILGSIAALLGGHEVGTISSIARDCKIANGGEAGDSPAEVMAVLEALGGDGSPTVRLVKCLHQKFVLESVARLITAGGPIEGWALADDRSPQGWRVTVDRPHGDENDTTQPAAIRVRHLRRDRVVPLGAFSKVNECVESAHLRWELVMVFGPLAQELRRTTLRVISLDLPPTGLGLSGKLGELAQRIPAGGIQVE